MLPFSYDTYHLDLCEFAAGAVSAWWMTRNGNPIVQYLTKQDGHQLPLSIRKGPSCITTVHDQDSVSLVALYEFQNLSRPGASSVIELRVTYTRMRELVPEGACRVAVAYSWRSHRKFDFPRYRELEKQAVFDSARTMAMTAMDDAFWWDAGLGTHTLASEDSGIVYTATDLVRWLQQLPSVVFPTWFEGETQVRMHEATRAFVLNRVEETLTGSQVLSIAKQMPIRDLMAQALAQVEARLNEYLQGVGLCCKYGVLTCLVPLQEVEPDIISAEHIVSTVHEHSDDGDEVLARARVHGVLRWDASTQSWTFTVTVEIKPENGSQPITQTWHAPSFELTPATFNDIEAQQNWLQNYDVSPQRWANLAAMANIMQDRVNP